MNNNNTGGIGFFGLLQILLIGLKLTGSITWSWWIVLSPILVLMLILILIIISTILLVALS